MGIFDSDSDKAQRKGAADARAGKDRAPPWQRPFESKKSLKARCSAYDAAYFQVIGGRDGADGTILKSVPTYFIGESLESEHLRERAYEHGRKQVRRRSRRGHSTTSSGTTYSSSAETGNGPGIGTALVVAGVILAAIAYGARDDGSRPADRPFTQTPVAPQPPPPVEKTVRENPHHGSYQVDVTSAQSIGADTVVDLRLTNLSPRRTLALFGSGRSEMANGQLANGPLPFLRDAMGREYLAKLPVIRGPASERVTEDPGHDGLRTIKVALPPSSAVMARLHFPRVPPALSVRLHVPYYGNLVTHAFTPNALDAAPVKLSAGELGVVRRADAEATVSIRRAGISSGMSPSGEPLGESRVFAADEPYGNKRRVSVTYFADFEGAVPERTRFKVLLEYEGRPVPTSVSHCPIPQPIVERGVLSCKTSGYYLQAGSWSAILVADGRTVNRTDFSIVPR